MRAKCRAWHAKSSLFWLPVFNYSNKRQSVTVHFSRILSFFFSRPQFLRLARTHSKTLFAIPRVCGFCSTHEKRLNFWNAHFSEAPRALFCPTLSFFHSEFSLLSFCFFLLFGFELKRKFCSFRRYSNRIEIYVTTKRNCIHMRQILTGRMALIFFNARTCFVASSENVI